MALISRHWPVLRLQSLACSFAKCQFQPAHTSHSSKIKAIFFSENAASSAVIRTNFVQPWKQCCILTSPQLLSLSCSFKMQKVCLRKLHWRKCWGGELLRNVSQLDKNYCSLATRWRWHWKVQIFLFPTFHWQHDNSPFPQNFTTHSFYTNSEWLSSCSSG